MEYLYFSSWSFDFYANDHNFTALDLNAYDMELFCSSLWNIPRLNYIYLNTWRLY